MQEKRHSPDHGILNRNHVDQDTAVIGECDAANERAENVLDCCCNSAETK